MNSWRDIKEQILVITGFTHPSYFTEDKIARYFIEVSELTGMQIAKMPVFNLFEEKIPLPDGSFCSGLSAWGVWTTSGMSIYTWDIGKITFVIHTCKEFDSKKVVDFTRSYFFLGDYEWDEIKIPKYPFPTKLLEQGLEEE
jgi:hypothetical protein